MGDRHDYVALEWVKGEIAETLKLAHQAIEAVLDDPQAFPGLDECLDYIHQVHGSLQMVEFYGAALLAEEMEHLVEALQHERVSHRDEALHLLLQALGQLPIYLDRVQSARRDLPLENFFLDYGKQDRQALTQSCRLQKVRHGQNPEALVRGRNRPLLLLFPFPCRAF